MSEVTLEAEYLPIVLALAQEAAKAVQSYQKNPIVIERKEDSSPLTEADLHSDRIIREGLLKNFPEHGILTEETGLIGKTDSEYTWVVDPLDGTKAFALKIPGYCVMIGLLKKGEPILGVVVDPLEGHIYEAVRGQGTYHTFQGKREKVEVSQRDQYSQMPLIISTGFPPKKLETALGELGSPLVDPINSVGIKVGLMIRQVGDIYLNHHRVHYWDTCAPQIILEEAGGMFTLIDGSPFQYALDGQFCHPLPTLASNGRRHGDLIQLLGDLGLGE